MVRRALVVGSCLAVVIGCGGDKKPPVTAEPTMDAGDAPPSAPDGISTSDDAGAAPAPTTTAAAAPATTSSSPPSGTITSDDVPPECAKASASYEEKMRPALNKCYAEGKKKNPDLEGTVRISIAINATGKITSTKPAGTSELGDSVIECMVKAVKAAPFDGTSACKSKTVTVSKSYGKKAP